MPITPTSVTWDKKSATPTGVDAYGKQTFGSVAGYPKTVSGVYYPDKRALTFPAQAPGFLVEYDASLVSETYFDGKEGDLVTVNGVAMKVVAAAPYTLPFAARTSHVEYALAFLGQKSLS